MRDNYILHSTYCSARSESVSRTSIGFPTMMKQMFRILNGIKYITPTVTFNIYNRSKTKLN